MSWCILCPSTHQTEKNEETGEMEIFYAIDIKFRLLARHSIFIEVSYISEYIVAFNDYYKTNTRENFITAALNGSGVENWKILTRNNPASDYPSDFDVVLVSINIF
jgi:hypothetical protein